MKDDDTSFRMLKNLIKKNLGFNCDQYKESHFRRRIDVRLRASRAKTFSDYIDILNKNPAEYKQLMDTLTVNVTNFFRNPETYDVIERDVLPVIIKSKSSSPLKSIRIWSAGCSIGVEAYSIAILLHTLLKDDFNRYKISITGTDIDKGSLFKAQEGLYTEVEMKDVDAKIKDKYFVKKDNKYQVIEELRNLMTFKRQDLITDPKTKGFDAIFCRNVTIYFTKELQEQLYMDFYESLNTGGFFIMGKTETMIGPSKDVFKPFNTKERIYNK